MTYFYRVQGSDIQDSGVEGNLKKFKTLVNVANAFKNQGNCSLDVVGDISDGHISPEDFAKIHHENNPELASQLEQIVDQQKSLVDDLLAKHNKLPQELSVDDLSDQEKEGFDNIQKEYQVAILRSAIGGVNDYYSMINTILSKAEVPVFGVHGNNDHKYASQQLPSVSFTDIAEGIVDDNGMKLLGANNTNYDSEELQLFHTTGLLFKPDDANTLEESVAYQKFSQGQKAKVFQLHGPPNGVGMRSGHDNDSVGITKLIKEHKPQLVECGHFHKAEIKQVDGIVYARSSPDSFYVHIFNHNGNLEASDEYKYIN